MAEDDALFSSFRLAVPLASLKRRGDDDADPHSRWILELLELARIVRTMDDPQGHAPAWGDRSRQSVMRSQVAIAKRSASGLEAAFSALAEAQRECGVDDARMRGYHEAMQRVQADTRAVCDRFEIWLESNPDDTGMPRVSALQRIFVLPDPDHSEDSKEDYLDEFAEEDGGEANDTSPSPARQMQNEPPDNLKKQRQTSDLDAAEIQREQQEMLEAELASMATRLKSSTMAMNATLQTQTRDLDAMEELAQTNLDRVSDTAKKVEDRLKRKKGWKKRLATWSLIGTVVGVWVLCFMVMRTLPKRKVGIRDIGGAVGGAVGGLWRKVDGYFSGRPGLWEDETPEEESERVAREQQMLKERLARERERKREDRHSRRQQHHDDIRRAGGECQVLPNGRQICKASTANDDGHANIEEIKALNMAAEQKRRRIRENMANPPAVHAVDSDSVGAGREDGDPVGCVPRTDAMRRLEVRLVGLSRAIADARVAQESAEDSAEWVRHSHLGKIRKEHADVVRSLKAEEDRARHAFWTPERLTDARRANQAPESITFCMEGNKASLGRDETEREEKFAEEDRKRKLDEQSRAEREARAKEKERIEQETAEATRREAKREAELAEAERVEAERAEAERLERQRLEAERLADKDAERVEAERLERLRLEEERTAAQEAAQVEAERIERVRLKEE